MNTRFTKSYGYTSPYGGCWLEHYYARGGCNFFGEKIKTEKHFKEMLSRAGASPNLIILGNFIVDRHAIQAMCREKDINTVCSEDGFFPHYQTLHADPLGFCWESSLSRMIFRTISDSQRKRSCETRARWLKFEPRECPDRIRKPFVLWPLQLIGDRVNQWDLRVSSWSELLIHFRECLPKEYQLVIKPHPRGKASDIASPSVNELPNTCVIRADVDLRTLLSECSAVAGANSTVLMEARLMFQKPVYAYARSWFTGHAELFIPLSSRFDSRPLSLFERVENNRLQNNDQYLSDYCDWFLSQLLARQLDHTAAKNWEYLVEWTERLSYRSFTLHGEDIFQ